MYFEVNLAFHLAHVALPQAPEAHPCIPTAQVYDGSAVMRLPVILYMASKLLQTDSETGSHLSDKDDLLM